MLKLPWFRHRPSHADAKLAALDRVQATIEFLPDGTIVYANALFLVAVGYELKDIVGKHHRLFVDADYAASAEYAEFWQKLQAGQSDTGTYRRLDKDGREVWLQASYCPTRDRRGRVRRVLKFAKDVTAERIKATDMDCRLRAIDLAQGVIEFALDGTILHANDNFLHAVGYTLDEVVGQHHRLFVDPAESKSAAYQAFWASLRQGVHADGLYRRLGKNARVVWLQATYNPILDASGRPLKVIKYATDVTSQTLAVRVLQAELAGLPATIMGNAQKAAQANDIATDARQAAEHGCHAVDDVMRTMRSIQESMASVNSIVELIDSLTFQTNVLSLNASIEAAHAGHMGKGFAVVADEVRELARRSKLAAGEIHSLIEAADEHVGEGATFVGSAGSVMNEIVASVSGVGAIVGEIRESSLRQSMGVERLNRAVAALENVYGQP